MKKKFPSPYGDFVFQRFCLGRNGVADNCFRPLTGILFFNYTGKRIILHGKQNVSVPLRGFCFSTSLLH